MEEVNFKRRNFNDNCSILKEGLHPSLNLLFSLLGLNLNCGFHLVSALLNFILRLDPHSQYFICVIGATWMESHRQWFLPGIELYFFCRRAALQGEIPGTVGFNQWKAAVGNWLSARWTFLQSSKCNRKNEADGRFLNWLNVSLCCQQE